MSERAREDHRVRKREGQTSDDFFHFKLLTAIKTLLVRFIIRIKTIKQQNDVYCLTANYQKNGYIQYVKFIEVPSCSKALAQV